MEKRGEGLGHLVGEEISQYDILIATRPIYTTLAKKLERTEYTEKIPIYQEEEKARQALEQAKSRISQNPYRVVVTDRQELAEAAAQQNIMTVLLTYDSEAESTEVIQRIYHLNTAKKDWIANLDSLLNYDKPASAKTSLSEQLNILVVTRPGWRAVAERVAIDYGNLSLAGNPVEGRGMLTRGDYDLVITEESVIAREAAEKGIRFILTPPQSKLIHQALAKRNPGSYCIEILGGDYEEKLISALEEITSASEQKTTVLVVDDEEAQLRLTRQNLEDKGYEVKTAGNKQDAIAIAREGVDVVVTDLELSDAPSGGLHVLQMVKLNSPATPVILHTGYTSRNVHEAAKSFGVCDVLTKTSDSHEQLASMIAQALAEKPEEQRAGLTPFSDGIADEIVEKLSQKGPKEPTSDKRPKREEQPLHS